MEDLMTLKQMCEFSNININTMKRWLAQGIGPRPLWSPTGRRRFQKSEVIAWRQNFFKAERPGEAA